MPKENIFYEDEFFYAIYNIKPAVYGHSLIITKRHVELLKDMNKDESKDFIKFTNKVLFIVDKFTGTDQYDLILQRGEYAGQSINHIHFHIIPRKKDDGMETSKKEWVDTFKEREKTVNELNKKELLNITNQLRKIAETYSEEINKI